MRAVGYCRANPGDAHAREHLAGQREVIAAEARRRGWELIGAFDDGPPYTCSHAQLLLLMDASAPARR
jgi:hypothetical protein